MEWIKTETPQHGNGLKKNRNQNKILNFEISWNFSEIPQNSGFDEFPISFRFSKIYIHFHFNLKKFFGKFPNLNR